MRQSDFISRRKFVGAVGATAVASTLPSIAMADSTMRIVQGYAPAGVVGMVCRVIADALSPVVGEPVIVDSKPGGHGGIASAHVAKAKPDGRTMMLQGLPLVTNPAMGKAVGWKPEDFSGVCFIAQQPTIAVVNPKLGVKTLKEFVEYAKKHPGELSYLNGGNGSVGHLPPELLKANYGFDMVGVPYTGVAPGMPDLLANRLQFAMGFTTNVLKHIESGALIPLGINDDKRHPSLPDVPTFEEAGFGAGTVITKWYFVVPAQTPADVVKELGQKVQKAMQTDPKVAELLAKFGMNQAGPSQPAEVDQYIQSNVAKWNKFFKENPLKG